MDSKKCTVKRIDVKFCKCLEIFTMLNNILVLLGDKIISKIMDFGKKKDSQFLASLFVRWAMTGSNRRHFGCKPNALPAELIALTFVTI